jgi:hypothetical protein
MTGGSSSMAGRISSVRLAQVAWMAPAALGALFVALVLAVIVARDERQFHARSPVPQAVAVPQAAARHQGKVAKTVPLATSVVYGAGLTHIVPSPVASLRPLFGNDWRELGASIGRVLIHPSGKPSRYVELSAVTFVRHSARLEVLTSEGQRAIELVEAGHYRLTNFGPLLDSRRGPIGVALTTVQPQSPVRGANIIFSPLQAEYLAKGQWVTGIPALAAVGPEGLRGVSLANGSTTQFQMTAGIHGRCELLLEGVGVGGPLRVSVTVGTQVRSAVVSGHRTVMRIGRFAHPDSVLSLSVSSMPRSPEADLFIHDMRFVASR